MIGYNSSSETTVRLFIQAVGVSKGAWFSTFSSGYVCKILIMHSDRCCFIIRLKHHQYFIVCPVCVLELSKYCMYLRAIVNGTKYFDNFGDTLQLAEDECIIKLKASRTICIWAIKQCTAILSELDIKSFQGIG